MLWRSHEKEAWKHDGWDDLQDGERLLLWHGSRTANFAGMPSSVLSPVLTHIFPGILKQGLRIAPLEGSYNAYWLESAVDLTNNQHQ